VRLQRNCGKQRPGHVFMVGGARRSKGPPRRRGVGDEAASMSFLARPSNALVVAASGLN